MLFCMIVPTQGMCLKPSMQGSTSTFGVSLIRCSAHTDCIGAQRNRSVVFLHHTQLGLPKMPSATGFRALQPPSVCTPLLAEPVAGFSLSQAKLCCWMLCQSGLQECVQVECVQVFCALCAFHHSSRALLRAPFGASETSEIPLGHSFALGKKLAENFLLEAAASLRNC